MSVLNREFAARFVSNALPDSFRYLVRLNQSFDGNELKPGERIFPDDITLHGECVGPLSLDGAVSLLFRDGLVPEWIDISVESVDGKHTDFELLCCGRFTADESLLYYRDSGVAPFGCKSPPIPPRWSEQDGRFDVHWRRHR